MENASKALLMAGGLLISILLVSFMVFVLRKAGSMSAEYDQQISENELAEFNGQFEVYAKQDNTFFDVITVANLAYDINKKNGYDEQNGITVKIINENNNQVAYSILNSDKLKKDCFFKGGDSTTDPIYIYNEGQSNLSGKSIIDYYTARNEDNSNYIYKFDCVGENSITYNSITGKVNGMAFKIVKK